ncbi:site-specific DNA-methyltransferase [Rhodoferax sp.]|uniref:site-specific DNA-methyltransferase n=1 Tax=Rhodoferax sp. TaxID=50421 RepID=UPI002730CAEF|nr:site-specific DNA-methyltransferase [Rhodoferax sp.]MDP2442493.1 site-specific DNA-methyltransferase [Rhodoferax sp.]MDZ4209153.1 site-specific DNA-methyltransferase [Rhodoferax sp.]
MSELTFKGQEFVYNHHLTVPHRPLVPDASKSVGDARLDGNLIINGDNLHGLKSLLPMYAGKVDCVFIDPPYNTGNEGWNYNDNVNSPMMQEWLRSNPVGIDDGLRHDKWCAMMWPRLRLLHELLGDAGSLWVTLDDNEIHRARSMLDSIFGEQNFVATCIWHKNYSPKPSAQFFSEDHDYLLIYAKDKTIWRPKLLDRTDDMNARYSNPDNDRRGEWKPGDLSARNYYSEGTYPITCPSGRVIAGPSGGNYWRVKESKFKEMDRDGRIWWGEDGNNIPSIKRFLTDVKDGRVPQTLWEYDEVGHTQDAKKELLSILDFASSDDVFVTPKPTALLARVLDLATTEHSIVLDSFAGSGTTGHAVLAANKRDGGDRKFILVECEQYADTLTAERMRRVIEGYAFDGKQREELLKKSLTFTDLKRADRLIAHVTSIENLEAHRFDAIEKKVKDGILTVEGVKNITERVEGLGGQFTFCTLGEAIDLDRMLTGESLPSFEQLGALLFHMATNEAINPGTVSVQDGHGYLGESARFHVWLIYKPELNFLTSRDAALTMAKAKALAEEKPGKRHLVFAPAKFVSQKLLDEAHVPVEFAPLPWALYRAERG